MTITPHQGTWARPRSPKEFAQDVRIWVALERLTVDMVLELEDVALAAVTWRRCARPRTSIWRL